VLKIVVACPTKAEFTIEALTDSRLGGLETANVELSRALADRGHRVILATRTPDTFERSGVTTVPLATIGQQSCDVLISSNDARMFDHAKPGARKLLWLHNPLAFEKSIRKHQLPAFIRHRPEAVFVGTFAEKDMTSLYPFRSRNVIPHGISGLFLTRNLELPRRKHFVWASQRQRGLKETLDTWTRHVAPKVADASFHIFGSLAQDLGLTDAQAAQNRIVFHGSKLKSELADFYATATAMIYPGALDETFCIAAAEAQAMGLPVITLGIGSLSERVQQGINGIVCKTYRDLGLHACRVADDEELWKLLHKGAISTAKLLTWRRTAKLWEALMLNGTASG
jgi:glycosyltransferase involved in cell wall biosynthesis